MLLVLALVTAVVVGGVVLLLAGPVPAAAVGLLLLVAGVVALRADDGVRRGIGITLLVALLAIGSYGSLLTFELVEAATTTDGAVDLADPDALGSAEAKLAGVASASAFRLELTEPELQAVVQDGLATQVTGPIRRIDLDLRGPTQDLAYAAHFKARDVRAEGTATVAAVDGGIDVVLGPISFGPVRVPALAAGAVQSLLTAVTDLNAALAAQGAWVQAVTVTDDVLVVTGTRATTDVLTSADLLDAIRAQAGMSLADVQAPPERVGRGEVPGPEAPGEPLVLGLGDSLAAGVGVEDLRDGWVSRVHGALRRGDGVGYGLANLARPGETSGSMLSGGQLEEAVSRLAGVPTAYVLLDIGANDLLGHLTSPDCSADLASAGCQQRVDQTLVDYRANLGRILDRLVGVAGDARVVLLQTYNPFSLGLGEGTQERQSSAIVARLNAVAAEEAAPRGVTVADGFTPMQGTTAVTTRMLDDVPDIHPNALGHDVLAAAVLDAL